MKAYLHKLLFLAIVFIYTISLSATEFYVSPEGNDKNPGTKDLPFATIEKVRDAVREINTPELESDIIVYLRGGTYQISRTLVFDTRDLHMRYQRTPLLDPDRGST